MKLITRKTKRVKEAWEKLGAILCAGTKVPTISEIELAKQRTDTGLYCFDHKGEILFGYDPSPLARATKEDPEYSVVQGTKGNFYAFVIYEEKIFPVSKLIYEGEEAYLSEPGSWEDPKDSEKLDDCLLLLNGKAIPACHGCIIQEKLVSADPEPINCYQCAV